MNVRAIGEILWDVYPEGKRLGGAPFNFIYHVWKISGAGNFISSVGNDKYGNEILSYLNSKKFPADYIIIDKDHPTGTVTVKLLEDKTPKFTISAECSYDYILLDQKSSELINNKTDMLYFGTLSQRSGTSRKTIQSLFGKDLKYFCDLNLRHDFFSNEMIEKALKVCDVIKINIDELDKIKNLFSLNPDDKKAIEQLNKNYKIDLVCVTYGGDGALLYSDNEFSQHNAETKNIVDTVGAGDAFAAVLCLGYLHKMELKKLNRLANEFASDICMINGAIPADDSIYGKYIREFENDS